jgi:hypothetical protein
MNDNSKKSSNKQKHQSVLESLKDVGKDAGNTFRKDLLEGASRDMLRQILGEARPKKLSGEMKPGESIEFGELREGTHTQKQEERRRSALETRLLKEEKRNVEKKKEELKIQLYALQNEVAKLAEATQELGEKTKVAAMQAPVEPGVYHLVYFEKLLEFIQSFRKKVENASIWLNATNKRAQKKNYWATYKKHGSKFLLSPDHYLTRSAG